MAWSWITTRRAPPQPPQYRPEEYSSPERVGPFRAQIKEVAMKIQNKLRGDPGEALKATQAALAETELRIRGLEQERTTKLLESDGLEEVAALDEQIRAQHVGAGIHRDRIVALKAEVRRQELEALDRQHGLKIAATEKAVLDRDAIAAKLETAIGDFGRLYFELIDQNVEIARLWGFSDNARRVGALGESIVAREVSHTLFAVGRPRNGISRLPAPGNVGLGVTGDTSGGTLAERLAGASAALLEMIRTVPTNIDEEAA